MAYGRWSCAFRHIGWTEHSSTLREHSRGGAMSGNFQELRVWQHSMALAERTYGFTKRFPKDEQYGMVSQMRRAAVSVASNIAEGKGHRSDKEFLHFLYHARGSLYELQTQVLLAKQLQYLGESHFREEMENIT